MERLCSWPSWISARTRSHSRKGPERPLGSPDHGYDGETVSPSPQFNSQTRQVWLYVPRLRQGSALDIPSAGPNALILCDLWLDARFVAATLCQHSPSDPRQLIGKCSCQDVVMQALRRRREPQPKAMLRPVYWSEQNNAGALHEERAQIAIATLGDAAEDGTITRGHLLRHQAEPGGKVAPSCKGNSVADRSYHCAGDEWADAGNGHQLAATLTAMRQNLDLF